MRINCLSFLDPAVHGGGGEMITRSLLRTGRLRGHDIAVSSVRPRRRETHERPDIVLLIDVFNHAHSYRSLGAWRRFEVGFLERAIAQAPFVHLTTGYPDVCNLPYLPCSGIRGADCPKKPLRDFGRRVLLREFGTGCFADRPLARRLFEDAALNCFFSPLHRDITQRLLGMKVPPRSHIIGPMIDTGLFRNLRLNRDIENLFVGVISEAKGLEEMRARFAGHEIVLIGTVAPGARLDFGTHVGPIAYAQIPRWMNRARNFVFLPRWPEPQGRVVSEAALCGCNIIANENVGALSLGIDLSDPRNYGNEEEKFWMAVEAVI